MLVITFRYAAEVTNLQMSFAEASWLRVVQMLPLPFCFISITNAAYIGMPQQQSNQVSGLINFVRNIGGSILIALTNAQVTSRAMWHEQHLQQAMQSRAIAYEQHVHALSGFFSGSFGGPNGNGMAIAQIYNQLIAQATDPGLPGRLHGAFLCVHSSHYPVVHARQEPPGSRCRRRWNALRAVEVRTRRPLASCPIHTHPVPRLCCAS